MAAQSSATKVRSVTSGRWPTRRQMREATGSRHTDTRSSRMKRRMSSTRAFTDGYRSAGSVAVARSMILTTAFGMRSPSNARIGSRCPRCAICSVSSGVGLVRGSRSVRASCSIMPSANWSDAGP